MFLIHIRKGPSQSILTEFAVKDPVIFILSEFAVEKSQLFCHLLSELACQK